MAPNTTVWPLDPHTLAKHRILRSYLDAWFPIVGKEFSRILYYDGFAGPGRYSAGEQGSPLIALESARQHAGRLRGEVSFVFVEEDRNRSDRLRQEIAALGALPQNFRHQIIPATFADALRTTLNQLDRAGQQVVVPTFALIDPFGVSGLPFELIARLLARQSCEVLVTFMTEPIKRFVEVAEVANRLPELFGLPDAARLIAASPDRVRRARELYAEQLRSVARYVRYFEMRNDKGVPIYDLFFASSNALGHYRMKEAMWRIDDSGDYSFSDGIGPGQATLFRGDIGRCLAIPMVAHFAGRQVSAGEVLAWTRDESIYLEKHAREALKVLEVTGVDGKKVAVDPVKRDGKPRRRGTFPAETVLRFP